MSSGTGQVLTGVDKPFGGIPFVLGGGGSKDEEDEVVEPKCGAGGDLSDV